MCKFIVTLTKIDRIRNGKLVISSFIALPARLHRVDAIVVPADFKIKVEVAVCHGRYEIRNTKYEIRDRLYDRRISLHCQGIETLRHHARLVCAFHN